MRSPLTGVIFALELTHDMNILLPLLLAGMIAHGFTVLTLRRSILTEKVARRGYHLSREYEIDPLEIIFAREVTRTAVVALPLDTSRAAAADIFGEKIPINVKNEQRLFPVVDEQKKLAGVITRGGIWQWLNSTDGENVTLREIMEANPILAYDDEPLRMVVYRMAEKGITRMPVVSRDRTFFGMIALTDLLAARSRILEAENRRERVLGARLRLWGKSDAATPVA